MVVVEVEVEVGVVVEVEVGVVVGVVVGVGVGVVVEVVVGVGVEMIDLRHGFWRTVLDDVRDVDTLVCDPPYSARVSVGMRSKNAKGADEAFEVGFGYDALVEEDAETLAGVWYGRARWWTVIFCDHVAWRWHEAAWAKRDWYTFRPVPVVRKGAPPRFAGDGPASAADFLMIARPRHRLPKERSGSRPGWYSAGTVRGAMRGAMRGAKPLDLMDAIVRDYTVEGDVVCDPYAGTGTTLVAAAARARKAVGAEANLERYEIARARCEALKAARSA